MTETTSAREEILARIRTALAGEPINVAGSYASISRKYRTAEDLTSEQKIALFLDRLHDYDTEILQVEGEAGIAGAVEASLRAAGEDQVLIAQEFPLTWRPKGIRVQTDETLSASQIEAAQAVLTTCEAAVAGTGTLFLIHEGAQGRRILTLLPDHHICIVRHSQLFATLPEAMRAIGDQMAKPITTISGPSATSDIEMIRVRGVHGPRRLSVVLCP